MCKHTNFNRFCAFKTKGKFLKICCSTLIFIASKRSLGQGNIFTPVCRSVHGGGGVVSQHALQVISQHALQQGGCYPSMPCSRGCLVWGGLLPGGGCLVRGVPGPGGSAPGECLVGGLLQGGAWWRPPRTATAAGGTTGIHSCEIETIWSLCFNFNC